MERSNGARDLVAGEGKAEYCDWGKESDSCAEQTEQRRKSLTGGGI